jgi:hypothetical protein
MQEISAQFTGIFRGTHNNCIHQMTRNAASLTGKFIGATGDAKR